MNGASRQDDLADRFEMVLEAVEKDESSATNRVTPGKVILESTTTTAISTAVTTESHRNSSASSPTPAPPTPP